jgi:hypothetical protein
MLNDRFVVKKVQRHPIMGCRFSLLSAYTGIEKYLNKNQSWIKWIKHESNQIKHGLNKNQCF